MKYSPLLMFSLFGGVATTGVLAVSNVSTQKMLLQSYFSQNTTSKICGPVDLESYTSASFFPSGTEMYIWNAGTLSYYVLQHQKAVRRWTATPVLPTQQVVGPVRRIEKANTFVQWFMKGHGLRTLEVTNECGALPQDLRRGPLYEVKVRAAYRSTLHPGGQVTRRKQVASNITDPRLYLSPK